MRKRLSVLLPLLTVAGVLLAAEPSKPSGKTYDVTADTIEGCSCPLFCTCYFGPSADEHSCMANNVYKFRKGSHYGDVDLSDQIVWVSLDLGGEWHHHPGPGMPTKWAVVTFDKKSSEAQRKAIGEVLGIVFPVKWGKFSTREDTIEFHQDAKMAHAKMASGMGEITLDMTAGADKKGPSVLKNLQYWFSTSNDGFVLAYSTHHWDGENKFKQEHKNGFTIAWTAKGEVKPEGAKVAMK
ncbi:MAG TPA: DUF1326 domain-containing protein [Thermoanaerobaculia bacterium]|nr:DUF1326 domain-containing protein [Thermoanaerobaculia bacterium]